MEKKSYKRKPDWLKVKITDAKNLTSVHHLIASKGLNTVCQGANCPNILECYGKKTATFMILGATCTRHCTFCNIETGTLNCPDITEPTRVAEAIRELKLEHAVITSVTRDDLSDGGADHFKSTILEVRKLNPTTTIEVLIPDFQGDLNALLTVIDAKPDIINHNVETIERLYSTIRPEAKYHRSLELLKRIKSYGKGIISKSGFMVGLGESTEEIETLIRDLKGIDLDFLTIGQYIPPSLDHAEVIEYVHPDTFKEYENFANEIGIETVASGPLVRSSYNAKELLESKNNEA